jgi:hypothetical protein
MLMYVCVVCAPLTDPLYVHVYVYGVQYGPVLSRLKDLVPKNFIKAKGEFQV